MSAGRLVASLLGTAGCLVLLQVASGPLIAHHPPDQAVLRIAFRAHPERIEVCRTPTEQELEGVAVHMRQEVICAGTAASYRLRLVMDDSLLLDDVVRGGGLRHDRPLQLQLERVVPPGLRRVRLSLVRRESAPPDSVLTPAAPASESDEGLRDSRAARAAEGRVRRNQAPLPQTLTLDTSVTFPARRVVLVTIDPDTRAWRFQGATP